MHGATPVAEEHLLEGLNEQFMKVFSAVSFSRS